MLVQSLDQKNYLKLHFVGRVPAHRELWSLQHPEIVRLHPWYQYFELLFSLLTLEYYFDFEAKLLVHGQLTAPIRWAMV